METQHPDVHQHLNAILNILSYMISCDFMHTKDRHYIDFISFNVKCPIVYTHAQHFKRSQMCIFGINNCRLSLATISKIMIFWMCGTIFQVFLLRFS